MVHSQFDVNCRMQMVREGEQERRRETGELLKPAPRCDQQVSQNFLKGIERHFPRDSPRDFPGDSPKDFFAIFCHRQRHKPRFGR